MAITGSQPAYRMAQAGVMRAGTSRSNVHSPLVFIAIGGVQVAAARAVPANLALAETLTIAETEGQTPNTATFTVQGFQPTDGQDVVITLGSINNLEREFAGTILTDAHGYVGTPANGNDQVSVIDYTWQLTRRTITQRWTNVSATVIAQAILAQAPGFTSLLVQTGLPVVSEFTVNDLTHAAALDALAAAIGGSWKATYHKDCRFGIASDPSQTDPTVLTAASALLTGMDAFAVTRDLSQVITQQPVQGGGSTALTDVGVGETILPVVDVSWFNPAGGLVKSGPQILGYTGLTGAGITPAITPTVTPAPGTGVELGVHGYAYTDVTAAGETLPSPLATVTIAVVPNPPAAPTVSTTPGSALPAGTYQYGYTDVAGAGETAVSAPASIVLPVGAPPAAVTAQNLADGSTTLVPGTYLYANTYVTPTGESAGSTTTPFVSYDAPTPPAPTGVANNVGSGNANAGLSYKFGVAWQYGGTPITNGNSSLPSAASANVVCGTNGFVLTLPAWNGPAADVSQFHIRVFCTVSGGAGGLFLMAEHALTLPASLSTQVVNFVSSLPDSTIAGSAAAPSSNTGYVRGAIIVLPSVPSPATGQNLYRTILGGAQLKFVMTGAALLIAGGHDSVADGSLGANIPTVSLAMVVVPVVSVAVAAPPGATGRNLYRTVVGGTQLKLDGASLGSGDLTLDGSLGANAPTTNTAVIQRAAIGNVALGPIGTTARKIYRTTAGGSQLKLQQTIANNTVMVGVLDSTPDASLGANVPTTDTSMLVVFGSTTLSSGAAAGATTLAVTASTTFPSTGGWVVLGNILVRYTGTGSGTLTGIPATGIGSVLVAIPSGTLVEGTPALLGIPASGTGSILYPIKAGDAVNLRVVVDDLAAQAALTALMLPTVDDGIVVGALLSGTFSETEARADGAAQLALQSLIATSVAFTTRDLNAHAGRRQGVSLPSPTSCSGTFLVQSVTSTNYQPAIFPTRTVTAASNLFTLPDLLRIALTGA